MTRSFWWYKEVPVHLDTFSPLEPPIVHRIPKDGRDASILEANTRARETQPQGGVHHLVSDPEAFIYWRVIDHDRVLELRHLSTNSPSLDDQHGSNEVLSMMAPVRFVFPAPIVPDVYFFEIEQSLFVYLVLTTGVFYRLKFTAPSYFSTRSIPKNYCSYFRLRHLENKRPVVVHAVNKDVIIIGCHDGSLVELSASGRDEGDMDTDEIRDFEENELVENNFLSQVKSLPRFLSSAFRRSGNETSTFGDLDSSLSQPIALTSYQHSSNTYVFAICRDRKLRVWSLASKLCVKTIPLPSSSGSQTTSAREVGSNGLLQTGEFPFSAAPKRYIQILEHDVVPNSASFCIITFVPTEPDPFFALYLCELDPMSRTIKTLALEYSKFCDASQWSLSGLLPEDLVQFHVLKVPVGEVDDEGEITTSQKPALWTLWTLWRRQHEAVIRYSNLQATKELQQQGAGEIQAEMVFKANTIGERWHNIVLPNRVNVDAAYFDNLLATTSKDVPELFCEYIFEPGRFSRTQILQALLAYRNSSASKSGDASLQTPTRREQDLREQVAEAVAQHTHLEFHSDSGVPQYDEHRRLVKTEWLRFLALCIHYRHEADLPVGMAFDPRTNMFTVVKRNCLSAIRVCDELEVLHHHFNGDFDLAELYIVPRYLLTQSYPHLASDETARALLSLVKSMRFLVAGIPQGMMIQIEEELTVLLNSPSYVSAVSEAQDYFDRNLQEIVTGTLRRRLVNALRECSKLGDSISLLFDLLNSSEGIERPPANNQLQKTSIYVDALISEGVYQTIQSRYTLARDLFLLISTILGLELSVVNISEGALLYSTGAATLRCYQMLRWVCSQSVPSAETSLPHIASHPVEDNAIVRKFTGLQVSETSVNTANAMSFLDYSLIHTLLHHHYPTYLDLVTQPASIYIQLGVTHFLKASGFLSRRSYTETTLEHVLFVHRLEAFGKTELALDFARFLAKLPSVQYVVGRAYVKEGDYERAADCFLDASVAFIGKTGDKYLEQILPAGLYRSGLPFYYQHVMELFEEYSVADHSVEFARLALRSIDDDISDATKDIVPVLWFKIFKNSLDQLRFDDAYTAMMANPDSTTQRDSLRHLIAVLCETGRAAKLTEFSFSGLQHEVERTLLFKARNSSALEKPNYYNVLYSYHVFRGDYRNAASVMYQYARRLGALVKPKSFVDVVAEQAKALLAAINSLAMVDDPYGWIVIPKGNAEGEKEGELERKRKTFNLDATTEGEKSSTANKRHLDIAQREDLQREYMLALARLQLVQKYPNLRNTGALTAEESVSLYTQAGLYDYAISTALAFSVDLRGVFESLVVRCVRLAAAEKSNRPLEAEEDWLFANEIVMAGTASQRAWKLLQGLLEQYDTQETNYRYRACVLEKLLSTDPNSKIPAWLSAFYKKHNLEDLARVCLSHGLLEEATNFLLQQIDRESETKPVSLLVSSRWLPYSLIDLLLATIEEAITEAAADETTTRRRGFSAPTEEESRRERLVELQSALQRKLRSYLAKVDEDYQNFVCAEREDLEEERRRGTFGREIDMEASS
ncbi:uncharacterized protein VTP21DRAFT_7343 [Calcarisporiella thermophila]|uniref:uncharacterized protein n=1 Tax=Calcarisporiella thermophila TaxID=911321 RepID=UPI0037430A05